jgi:hypothetical protein
MLELQAQHKKVQNKIRSNFHEESKSEFCLLSQSVLDFYLKADLGSLSAD